MDISFGELKNKEIINILDGRRLGHIIDILFENSTGTVMGIVVPGEKKLFRKNEDVFIPLELIRKIGDDVILVRLDVQPRYNFASANNFEPNREKYLGNSKYYGQGQSNNGSFVRFKRVDNKKYK